MKYYKIRHKHTRKYLGYRKFTDRGRFWKNSEGLLKALKALSRVEEKYSFHDLEIVEYKMKEIAVEDAVMYYLEVLI